METKEKIKLINEHLLSRYIKSYINPQNIFDLANKLAIIVTITVAFVLIIKSILNIKIMKRVFRRDE